MGATWNYLESPEPTPATCYSISMPDQPPNPPQVTLYSQPGCAPCFAAKAFLQSRHIPFQYKDVQADPQAFRELMDLGSRSTPTLLVGTEVMIGFDPARLEEMLHAAASAGTRNQP
jgi:glutaredoxin